MTGFFWVEGLNAHCVGAIATKLLIPQIVDDDNDRCLAHSSFLL